SLARAMRGQGRRRRDARRPQHDLGKLRRLSLVEPVDAKKPTVAVESGALLFGRQTLAFAPPAEMFEPPFRHPTLPGCKLERISEPSQLSNLKLVRLFVERGDQTVDAAAAQDQRKIRSTRRQFADRTRQINVPNLPSGVVVV